MKKMLCFLSLFLLCAYYHCFSQSLVIGDIAFTGYNADPTNDFSFIILKSGGIVTGTQIRFTDRAWSSGSCAFPVWGTVSNEEEVLWTANSNLAYGTQVRINGLTASAGTVTGTALNFSSAGDQIFALQGTLAAPSTIIAGIHMNEEIGSTSAANWDNVATPNGSQSNRPSCLTNGTYALFINPKVKYARLKLTVTITLIPATDRATINNAANWDVDNETPFLGTQRVGIGTNNPQQKLDVSGSIRQSVFSQAVTVNGNSGMSFTWTHNLGYQPVIMISLDQTGGGNMDYLNFSYQHIDNNQLNIYLTNRQGNSATGTVRWIVVY